MKHCHSGHLFLNGTIVVNLVAKLSPVSSMVNLCERKRNKKRKYRGYIANWWTPSSQNKNVRLFWKNNSLKKKKKTFWWNSVCKKCSYIKFHPKISWNYCSNEIHLNALMRQTWLEFSLGSFKNSVCKYVKGHTVYIKLQHGTVFSICMPKCMLFLWLDTRWI